MVRVEWRGRVVVVTIDRPARRNAVDHATSLGLVAAQQEAAERGARVMVLTGAPPAFSAGADLTGVESGEFVRALVAALTGFTSATYVTMAAVDGPALGAGTQLAISCDVRIATPRSVFGIPAAKLGLAIDRWTVERLAREMGPAAARAMLLTAETYDAPRLFASGGVHRLGGLDDALDWAEAIASLAPLTIAAHKLAIESTDEAAVEAAREAVWASSDAEEGRAAFLEKRAPQFQGR